MQDFFFDQVEINSVENCVLFCVIVILSRILADNQQNVVVNFHQDFIASTHNNFR
jgi:hypothetical protein